MEKMRLSNRVEAGSALAAALRPAIEPFDQQTFVLALPRGGVPVASEISTELGLPMDIVLVRKLGLPDKREIAMGAIATGGIRFLNEPLIQARRVDPSAIAEVVRREMVELGRRQELYRGARPWPKLRNKQVILVDDGLATGATMRVAVEAVREHAAAKIIMALPVAPAAMVREFEKRVDEVVCLLAPEDFCAVSLWYEEFPQIEDEEVIHLLQKNWCATTTDNTSVADDRVAHNMGHSGRLRSER